MNRTRPKDPPAVVVAIWDPTHTVRKDFSTHRDLGEAERVVKTLRGHGMDAVVVAAREEVRA